MALVQVDEITHWYNSGANALATLASGSDLYFIPSTTEGAVAAGSASSWAKYDVHGADVATLHWRMKIKVLGGVGNCTLPATKVIAVGSTGDFGDTALDTHPAVSAGSPTGLISTASRYNESLLYVQSASAAHAGSIPAAYTTAVSNNGGIFPLKSPLALNDTYWMSWTIGKRNNPTTGATGGDVWDRQLTVDGLKYIWLAVMTNQTLSGTLATTKVKGRLFLRLWKFVEMQRDRKDSQIVNKSRRLNIAAY